MTNQIAASGPAVPVDLVDRRIRFGQLKFEKGFAFTTRTAENTNGTGAPVSKQYTNIDNRKFLIESVKYAPLSSALHSLPAQAGVSNSRSAGYASIPRIPSAQTAVVEPDDAPTFAQVPSESGVVIDYRVTPSGDSYLTLYGDTTYYVPEPISVTGLSIEAGAVVKYAKVASTSLGPSISVETYPYYMSCDTTAYNPAIFTAVDDDSHGESMYGYAGDYTGIIGSGDYYGMPALRIGVYGGGSFGLTNCQFLYLADAVDIYTLYGSLTFNVDSCLFQDCYYGISSGYFGGGTGASLAVNLTGSIMYNCFVPFFIVTFNNNNSVIVGSSAIVGNWYCIVGPYDEPYTANNSLITHDPMGAPAINTEPSDQPFNVGGGATFEVDANSSYSMFPVGYDWFKTGDGTPLGHGASLSLTGLEVTNSGETYFCRVYNMFGYTNTRAAALVLAAPTFTTSPANTTFGLGGSANLTAEAINAANYYWYKVGSGSSVGSGGTLTLNNLQPGADGSIYCCRAYNALGDYTDSSTATLTWDRTPSTGQVYVWTPTGASFAPRVNGTNYNNGDFPPVATVDGKDLHVINPPIYKLNVGYGDDQARFEDYWPSFLTMAGGFSYGEDSTNELRAGQNVTWIDGLRACANLTNLYISHNPITSLDAGAPNLKDLEAFACQLQSVDLTGCSNLQRVVLESNYLSTIDVSHNPMLIDFRAGANHDQLTNIVFPSFSLALLWHLCIRDNPNLDPGFLASNLDYSYTDLAELFAWNCGQTGSLNLNADPNHPVWVQVSTNQLSGIDIGSQALKNMDACNNNFDTNALASIINGLTWASNTLAHVDLTTAAGTNYTTTAAYAEFDAMIPAVAANRGGGHDGQCLVDRPPTCDGTNGGDNSVTFVIQNQGGATNYMWLFTNAPATNLTWHWSDGTTDHGTNVWHTFTNQSVMYHTNYVTVEPPSAAYYFGKRQDDPPQGIVGVYGVSNFPSLYKLYLYHDNLKDLSLANCGVVQQLHLASNPVSSAVCDGWFQQLVDAGAASHGGDLWYPDVRTSSSFTNWQTLTNGGWIMHPIQ